VRFQLDPRSYPLVTSQHDIQDVSITQARGTLLFRGGGSLMGLAWTGLNYGIISMGVALFVLNRLRAIFRMLRDQNPFVGPNASRIRLIGIVLVMGPLASTGLGA
jgi:hypothetical protein